MFDLRPLSLWFLASCLFITLTFPSNVWAQDDPFPPPPPPTNPPPPHRIINIPNYSYQIHKILKRLRLLSYRMRRMRRKLKALKRSHRRSLRKLQKQHKRAIKALQKRLRRLEAGRSQATEPPPPRARAPKEPSAPKPQADSTKPDTAKPDVARPTQVTPRAKTPRAKELTRAPNQAPKSPKPSSREPDAPPAPQKVRPGKQSPGKDKRQALQERIRRLEEKLRRLKAKAAAPTKSRPAPPIIRPVRPVPARTKVAPFTLSARQYGSDQVMVTFHFNKLVQEISYKLPGETSFQSTERTKVLDPSTGRNYPKYYFTTKKLKAGKRTLQVKFMDAKGQWHGPFSESVTIRPKTHEEAAAFVRYVWPSKKIKELKYRTISNGMTQFTFVWAAKLAIMKKVAYSFQNKKLDNLLVKDGKEVGNLVHQIKLPPGDYRLFAQFTLVNGHKSPVIEYLLTVKQDQRWYSTHPI